MKTALDIFHNQPLLRTIYLLRQDIRVPSINPTEDEVEKFLLWIAIYGRKEYCGIIVDREFYQYITCPTDKYLSRLEQFYAKNIAKIEMTPDNSKNIHLLYYLDGVPSLNLAIFLTARELMTVEKTPAILDPPDANISIFDGVIYLSNEMLRGKFDLKTSFGRRYFKKWQRDNGADTQPLWLRIPATVRSSPLNGVNLIGYSEGVLGIGEDVRALAVLLRQQDIPFAVYNVPLSENHGSIQTSSLSEFFTDRPVFGTNIFCMTAFETARICAEKGIDLLSGRYNIGMWPWELSTIPSCWHHVFDLVDEIWAISPYLCDVYKSLTKKSVVYMPPYVNVDKTEPYDLADAGLSSDDFIFLIMLDFNSYVARKNPEGAIHAFKRAFPKDNGERLLIKTINGHVHPTMLEELLGHVHDDPRVVLTDGSLPRSEVCGLIGAVDCFVSLHRAEGFGRVIAEAMFLGTPVIATNWSGSKTLIDKTTGFPVDYQLRAVRPGEYTFEEGSHWAEPDLDQAAACFRLVRNQRSLVGRKVAAAKRRIARKHSLQVASAHIARRLADLEKAK